MALMQPIRFDIKNIIAVLIMSASLWLAFFGVVLAESITSFDSIIHVHQDGSLTVVETIKYDFGSEYKHGIYRTLADTHAQSASAWYKERHIDYELISVSRDGGIAEPYKIEDYAGLSVRIGDPDLTISGQHTYKITYRVYGALSYNVLSDGQKDYQLYWNVTGHEWKVSIENLTAVVKAAVDIDLTSPQYCYASTPGTVIYCDSTGFADDGIFYDSKIFPGQEFTIVQGLNMSEEVLVLERMAWLWPISVVGLLWLIGLGTWLYRWRFYYRRPGVVIPQYEPYADFRPMFTGVLIDSKLDARDISAGIVYLAQQGFISIKQTKDKVLFLFDSTDYEVALLRPMKEVETEFLKRVLSLLFSGSNSIGGETVKLSEIRNDHARRTKNAKIIKYLRKAVVRDLVGLGFLELKIKRGLRYVIIFVCIWLLSFFGDLVFSLPAVLVLLVLLVLATIFLYVFFASERRTQKGHEALNHLKGFKDFLRVTDKERFSFHNAPGLSPQQFMEYLPYAIAFGVEKEWSEVFKDIQIDSPDWYSSSAGGVFDAAVFTNNLSSFSTAFAGSTGSSGSSGGGSAGGGSGGGGGGSW